MEFCGTLGDRTILAATILGLALLPQGAFGSIVERKLCTHAGGALGGPLVVDDGAHVALHLTRRGAGAARIALLAALLHEFLSCMRPVCGMHHRSGLQEVTAQLEGGAHQAESLIMEAGRDGASLGNLAGAAEEVGAVAGVLWVRASEGRVRVCWGTAVPVQVPTCWRHLL